MLKMYGHRPLSKLEAGLYALMVGIFITIFANFMLDYMESAERSAMQATLLNTMGAVNTRLAQEVLLAGGAARVDWTRSDPFEIARARPPGFVGGLDARSLPAGAWTFDKFRAEVLYRPKRGAHLYTTSGDGVLRFRLVRSRFGYDLAPSEPYRWE